MVDVPPVGVQRILPPQRTAEEGKGRVAKRQRQRGRRDKKGHQRVDLEESHHRRRAEQKAQRLRPDVAHEDARRAAVIRQKAEAAPRQRGKQHRDLPLGNGGSDKEHRKRGDHRDPCGESVEPVDEIHCIRAADEPEHRQRQRKRPQRHIAQSSPRHGEDLDARSGAPGQGGGEQLNRKLERRAERKAVVQKAHQRDQQRPSHHAAERGARRQKDERGGKEAEQDRHAAEPRHGAAGRWP